MRKSLNDLEKGNVKVVWEKNSAEYTWLMIRLEGIKGILNYFYRKSGLVIGCMRMKVTEDSKVIIQCNLLNEKTRGYVRTGNTVINTKFYKSNECTYEEEGLWKTLFWFVKELYELKDGNAGLNIEYIEPVFFEGLVATWSKDSNDVLHLDVC